MGTNMIIGPCVGSGTQGALLNQIPEGNYLISLEGEFLTEVDNEEDLLTEIEEE